MIHYARTPSEYKIENDTLIFNGVTLLDLAATLECGQAFRWRSCSSGAYAGIVEGEVLQVSLEGERLAMKGTTAEKARFWPSYFALDLNYRRLPNIKKSTGQSENDTLILIRLVLYCDTPFGNALTHES